MIQRNLRKPKGITDGCCGEIIAISWDETKIKEETEQKIYIDYLMLY